MDRQAFNAADAGDFLAERLGLPRPITAQQIWKWARVGSLPHRRLGRLVYFLSDELEAFADGKALRGDQI